LVYRKGTFYAVYYEAGLIARTPVSIQPSPVLALVLKRPRPGILMVEISAPGIDCAFSGAGVFCYDD
jgi:hypothetical protein